MTDGFQPDRQNRVSVVDALGDFAANPAVPVPLAAVALTGADVITRSREAGLKVLDVLVVFGDDILDGSRAQLGVSGRRMTDQIERMEARFGTPEPPSVQPDL